VVRLSAAGKMFSVGGDIGFFAAAADRYAALHALADDLHAGLISLSELDAPVVARVHGTAAGAGMSLVCAADIAIGSPSASFTVAYTGVGLSPDGGSSWLLPRLVGWRRAADLMLTNRRVKADEALAIGLLTEVVPEDELDARVDSVVARLAAGPTASYGAVKRLLRESATTPFAEQLRAEAHSIATLAAAPTGLEGVAAFLEKRPAVYPQG
jgi:2-(1,2-epoxy-1,2-dihydrophenyl)acetyl-CoA isomerase